MKRLLLLLVLGVSAFAQDAEYVDDFQSYRAEATPPGWVGAFKVGPDPLNANNLVLGAKEPGSFATLTTVQFTGRFEFRGRLMRTSADERIGIAFFSGAPVRDAYYLIALSAPGGGKRRSVRSEAATQTMQLSARGGGAPSGTLDSGVSLDANRWYEFLVETDDFDGAMHIRARFWPVGTTEPGEWQIEARDPSPWRLDSGHIALWGAGYFDDLGARSWPAEEARAEIHFFDADSGAELDPSKLALFKKPARIDVRVSNHASPIVRLDGAPFTGAPIDADGTHEISVQAGFVSATLRLLVDQHPPSITLLGNNAPLVDGTVFGRDVLVGARVTDASRVTVTSSLGALPFPLAKEAPHTVTVTAVDQVGWSSTATATFTIDKTAPAITLLGNGIPFLGGHTFAQDVTLTWTAADATLDTLVATLDGAPIPNGTTVSAAAAYRVEVTASDRAGNVSQLARAFTLRKDAPEVRLLANGSPLLDKTYGAVIAITAEILDPTPVTHLARLDGVDYTLGTPIAEGAHAFTITARNAAGLETTIVASFIVDLTPPVIALAESGTPFGDGMKFNRDVLPQLTVTDNLDSAPLRTLLVNGIEYSIGAAIVEERLEHVITATATDDAGHTATIGPFRFVLDKTRPVVTIVEPVGELFAAPVQVKVTVEDLTPTTINATLGGTPVDINMPIAIDGTHQLSVVATDAVGWQSEPARATFTIDTIAPAIRFTSPADVNAPLVDVTGFADDAVSITINGRAASIDLASRTFVLEDVALTEGVNELVAVATDRAGNRGNATHAVTLDTRAPELVITAPAANACLDAASVEVRGTVIDRALADVKVNGVEAWVVEGTFAATVPFPSEGKFTITVEATDAGGLVSTATQPITIDRTAPVIEVTEVAALLNRPVALFPRVDEGTLAATLNGKPYVAGTAITADGAYELHVIATDCAGHTSTKTVAFEIDQTAPSILTFVPASGSTLGTKPQINGTTSPDAVSVTLDGTSYAVANAAFTIADAPLKHGPNELRLTVADRAGNSAEQTYALTLDLTTPAVEIVESGVPIPPNALFARDVTPIIRATERDATVTATLNSSVFTSGTTITASGAYMLTATASDAHGHTSAPVTATFTIDRAAPQIDITSPAAGAYVNDDLVDVRGTVSDSDLVSVNGVRATVANGAFTAKVPVDFGRSLLVATAIDRAGNAASDQIDITRGTGPLAIILTAPFDGLITNRRTTVVSGQVMTVAPDAKVTLNGVEIPVDPSGFFRKTDFVLTEGENVITAAVVNGAGERNQTSVRVIADLTPPRLRLLESGQPLADGARFADRAVLTVETSDGVPELVVDSDAVAPSTTIDEDGGHTVVATARDAAGNESRVERTIFIGGAGSGACRLSDFDPAHGASVSSPTVTISGRTGGASSVTVNGTPALVTNGSFCATVELPNEGDNAIVIACEGGDTQTLVLHRVTNAPSISIDAPAEGSVTTSETIAVSGRASGAVSIEVNGIPVTGESWSVPSVRLANGLNVIVARARGASGRTAAVSRRVLYLKDAPSVTITSPATALITGASRVDVSGGWANVDPATIRVNGAAAAVTSLSDTTGTFVARDVALVAGENTVTVIAGAASASVIVTVTAGYPSVSITEPADNAVFGASSGDTFTVRGTFNAAAGSTVEVAGEAATIDGNNFTATVPHTAGRVTPVLARLTEPEGSTGIDAIRVTKLAAPPKVLEHFPAVDAFDVDGGAMPLVLFSAPMDLASTRDAFRLENAAGSPVSGTLRLDRDVLTFAPAALLAPGERYTIRIAATAKSIAGDALESALATSFTVASSAGTQAPTLAPVTAGCTQLVSLAGTAPPTARLRIDLGTLTFTTTANAAGAWSFQLPVGGYSGYQVVRVRVVGSDGSLSPAAESCFLVDCAGPQVVAGTYDRTANRLTITFSKAIKPPGAQAITLRLSDNRGVGGSIAVDDKIVTVTPSEDLTRATFTLEVSTDIEDLGGTKLSFPYTQTFAYDVDAPPQPGDGSGFMSGEVFDAETGRPLAGASVFVDVTNTPMTTDARGRYSAKLPEGAHTIRVSKENYTSVWRQIVIPPGAGVIPIDIRLTPIGQPLDGQSLPGLLPLGWSPLAAAIATTTGQIEFNVNPAGRTITVVRYHDDRDEWRVLIAAANVVDGRITVPVDAPGAFALVYPDNAPELARPPTPTNGAVLTGVTNPCAQTPCVLEAQSFVLDPPVILPTGRTVATLTIDGAPNFPSGTAVQAYIDEELRLADGSRVTDPPFTTDLLLYRNLDGTAGIATFRLGPSPRAAEVILDVGFNHIRILPYPGRLDRGTLVGPEGGRVPGDGRVIVEIPAGAATEPLRATSATIDDLAQFGTINGFTIAAGFTFTLQPAREIDLPDSLTARPPELLQSARVTFPNSAPGQAILVEVLDGPRFRLAAQMDGGTTKPIDRAVLPLDGVIREGRYLLLKANAPIAFATGLLRDANGLYLRDARIAAPPLGVTDVTRVTGTYAIPVQTALFTLVPSTPASGDGAPYTHPSAPAQDAVVRVDLTLRAVPPKLIGTEPNDNATEVALTAFVKAHFDVDLDPASIADAIVVEGAPPADILLETPRTILWRLRGGEARLSPNHTYDVSIAPTIRAANGTPLGRTHHFSFSTLTQLTSNDIHPEKIRITLPDANGHSRVIGAPGALPAGYIALVTRRGREFVTVFQAQAANDGSFAINLTERVELTDLIDLQVLNNARAIAAILPLTPFVTDDGRAFLAPPDRTVTFHGDLASITVAAGTFDAPTLVTTAPAPKTDFTQVPAFESELTFHTGIAITFDGDAHHPLEVDLPIPAGTVTDGKSFFLARLGQSIRGPRVEIDDTLLVAGGKFTTRENTTALNVGIGERLDDNLLHVLKSGQYAVVEFQSPVAFVATEGVAAGIELFSSAYLSLYCSLDYLAELHGRAALPVRADQPFTVDGVDASTGLTAFKTVYTGVPLPPAGYVGVIGPVMANESGPYPVFARPLFVQIAEIHGEALKQIPVRGFEVELPARASAAVITRSGDAPREFGVLNVAGAFSPSSPDASRSIEAKVGDRLMIFGSAENIAPTREIELVFNEAIDATPETAGDFIVVEKKEGSAWQLVPVDYRIDSNGRRVWIDLRGELQRGGEYRVVIRASLKDVVATPKSLGVDLVMPFSVRKPHGDLLGGPFSLPDGAVRDLALDGNLLFVAASDGDLLAYDVSDPAALDTRPPLARASASADTPVDIPGETWTVVVDHHGRIWTTARSDSFGVIRSFRVEDFAKPATTTRPVKQVASSIVSWWPGANANLPLGTVWSIQTDRPEAIPRKIQVALQDQQFEAKGATTRSLEGFVENPLGATATNTGTEGEFGTFDVTIPRSNDKLRRQRVTVHNETAGLRWSADIPEGAESATLTGVLARPGDRLKVMRNVGTYAVVALLGHGLGFYDLNALEHNRQQPPAATQYREQIAITEARSPDKTCDESVQQAGEPCGPSALTFVSDAVIGPDTFQLFGLETRKGLVHVSVDDDGEARREGQLALTGSFGTTHNDHPRLVKIRKRFAEAGRTLNARFTGMARFDNEGKSYAIVAAGHFGLLVVDLKPPLGVDSLADVIWIPAGAYGVRHIAGTHYATAVDGEGRSLLIDLSRVDERREVPPIELEHCSMPCDTVIFPTVRKALASGADPDSPLRFGSDDPRIIWKSEPDLDNLYGTLAPVADPDTGFIYSGESLEQTIRVLAGLEPRVSIMAKPNGGPMQPVTAVVPLGIKPPAGVLPGGLGAFRVEVALPGSMAESAAGTLAMRVESERVPSIKVEPPPSGWPAAHADVILHRVLTNPALRYQKGWNFFVSDPVVVAADPRATSGYEPAWGATPLADKETAGCFSCERPSWVDAHAGTKEIYSYGRHLSLRPSPDAFAGRYAYVADRLATTIGTIMADTVRPTNVQVAGQNPPVAGGVLQETTYLHSGELETSAIDLVPGGRAGWDVAVDRTYRSRTLGWSPLGFGWDSALFKRLRVLPTGVEYRDGAEVWLFEPHATGYFSPRGLFLKLTRDDRGFTLIDQQWRITRFDDRGHVVSESDEFDNTLRYAYNDREQLVEVVDPVGRKTTLAYDPDTGFLREVKDWRGRIVKYDVADGVLQQVTLPAAKAAEGVPAELDHSAAPPRIQYVYSPASASFADRIELAPNLQWITDPHEVERDGDARVKFTCGDPGNPLQRDRVVKQTWATGETGIFEYTGDTILVTDALQQVRTYETRKGLDGREHIGRVTEHGLSLVTVDPAAVPAAAGVNERATLSDITTTFHEYGVQGELRRATYPNGLEVDLTWKPAGGGMAGLILDRIRDYGPSFVSVVTQMEYATAENAVNTVLARIRGEEGGEQVKRESPSPSRTNLTTVREDDGVKQTTTYTPAGQLQSLVVQDTTADPREPIRQTAGYHSATSSNLNERARPSRTATDDVAQAFTYTSTAGAGEQIETVDERRGTKVTTVTDSYGRTIRETVTGSDGEVVSDERFGYDESGRLAYHARRQQPLGFIETRVTYDVMGRATETSMTKASVGGDTTALVSKSEFDLPSRTIRRYDPAPAGSTASAYEETTLDGLGRPTLVIRAADAVGPRITRRSDYDLHGRLSYETDGVRTALVRKHDLLGRETLSVSGDGTRTKTTWSAWNEPLEQISEDADGTVVAHAKRFLTSKGRLRAINEKLSADGPLRQFRFTWKGGRVDTTHATRPMAFDRVEPVTGTWRVQQTERDLAGRVTATKMGETDGVALLTEPLKTWLQTETAYIGDAPTSTITSEPRSRAKYTSTVAYDALNRPTEVVEAGGAYTTLTVYDEAGNVLQLRRPGMNAERATFDARGLPLEQTLADGAKLKYVYDALGVLRERIDEAGERTTYETDALGRVVKVTYPDGSFEQTVYEQTTGAVQATRDRGGQWLSYTYDRGGRVTAIRNGEDPATAPDLVRYQYDRAGRLVLVKNKDAGIAYEDHDFLGRPRVTRTYRYAVNTGLADSPTVLDVHTQWHTWSIHDGERETWTMPVAGTVVPWADDPALPWLQTIVETRDAGGNLIRQAKATGETLLDAFGRAPGRLDYRKRSTLSTEYGYADGLTSPVDLPSPASIPVTGLPFSSRTTVGATTVAGSTILRDGAKRLASQRELATKRLSAWSYDDRGRVTESLLFAPSLDARPATDSLIHADFRARHTAPTFLTRAQHELLGGAALDIERPSWTQTKTGTLHQIDARTLLLDGEVKGTRDYAFDLAGRRAGDGRWTSTYDEFGRLVTMMSTDRRLEYQYDPNNRLIGRRSLVQNAADEWILDESNTFVWDPIVDRLVAVYETGASIRAGAAPHEGLIRQSLHGDQAYDDPTRIVTATTTYFPIFDESATGNLIAIAGPDGKLIERVLYADPYGAAPRYLHGPVVDRITTEARKTPSGDLAEVKLRIHLSDPITPTTLPPGIRVSAGTYTSTVTPTLEDPHTATLTLSASEWTALTTAPSAEAIEIAITAELRAEGWAGPVMALPTWAGTLYPNTSSTASYPVVVRENITALTSFIASIGAEASGTRTAWSLRDLYLAGVGGGGVGGVVGKGAPFMEPATGLVYLRDRWYDTATGAFLTPDRAGYLDGRNLYAAFVADPVNNSDPTGQWIESAWDVASLGLGTYQISQWDESTSFWTKTLDVVGVGVDAVALALPFVPGGAGAGLRAYRAGNALHHAYETGETIHRVLDAAQGVDQSLNILQGTYNIAEDFATGNVGWGTALNAVQSGIGFRSLSTRGLGGYRLDFSRGHATGSMLGTGGVRIARTRPTIAIPDDALVRFDATRFDRSIEEFGIQRRFFKDPTKVWLARYGDVKHIRNAADLETVLYRQDLWPEMVGRFAKGATLRVVANVEDAVAAGLTNKMNGVPQWRLLRDIPPADLTIVKWLAPYEP